MRPAWKKSRPAPDFPYTLFSFSQERLVSTMTWRSFQKLCRRNAERVPYHPEAFLQDAPSRPPQPLFVRFAALAGTAAVLVVAVAAVLLSSLFRSPSIPAGPDGGSALSSPLVPPDVDLLYIYSCLAEMTYTKKVEPFDAAAMTAAQQLQYANQVYLRQRGEPLFATQPAEASGQEEVVEGETGTAVIPLEEAQALLNRLFGPNAIRLSEQADIESFLSWNTESIFILKPHSPLSDGLTADYRATKRSSDFFPSASLTVPLFYYLEKVETVGTNVVVQTAAFTEENGSLSYPTDLSGYNRLQAQLKSRSRTEKPVKQATYTFGSENGTLYLLSCREADSVTASSPSVQSQPGTTTAPTTEPVWTNPTSDPPSLLDKVTWKGPYDPEPVMLILSANALNGKLDLQFDDPQDKQAVGSFWSILSGAFNSRVPLVGPEWGFEWESADMNPAIFERLQIPVYWDISVASLPFDSLNRMASHYFVGLRYAREELPTVFTEGPNETQILYDAETDRAYLVTAPTGIEPTVYLIAGVETEGHVVHYTLLSADGWEDAYSQYYKPYGFAAVQRYLLETFPFSSEHTSISRLSVDMETGQPRFLGHEHIGLAGSKLPSLLEKAREFVDVQPSDSVGTLEGGDPQVLLAIDKAIYGMAGFCTPEGNDDGMAVRYQDLMACMTTEVIGELEAGGYLTSVDGNAVTRPLLDVYQSDWCGGHVLSVARTDTDGVLDVIYAAPDFRYAKNRRFSIQMRQDENGGYFIASLPQEIK